MTETATKTRTKRTPEQLAAHFQAKANAARAKAGKKQRMVETRRKVIAGASLFGLVEAGDEDAKRVLAKIHAGLTRPQDRQVFGLDEQEESERPKLTLDELEQEIAKQVERNSSAGTKEEKKATAYDWRRAIAAWERVAGKMYPFPEGTDRSAIGLGAAGEVRAGW